MFGVLAYDNHANDYCLLIFKKKEDALEAFNELKFLGKLSELSLTNKIKVKLGMDRLSFIKLVKLNEAPKDIEIINKSTPLIY